MKLKTSLSATLITVLLTKTDTRLIIFINYFLSNFDVNMQRKFRFDGC